jgi:rare lipoprotein A
MKYFLYMVAIMWSLALHAAATTNSFAGSMHSQSREERIGVASWYGRREQGKIMANGKPFNSRAMTAASRTLPLGSWIRVFNLRNGNSVDVQVTDRGPNKRLRNRILDLSEAAARKLGFRGDGLTTVTFVPLAEKPISKRPPLRGREVASSTQATVETGQ